MVHVVDIDLFTVRVILVICRTAIFARLEEELAIVVWTAVQPPWDDVIIVGTVWE